MERELAQPEVRHPDHAFAPQDVLLPCAGEGCRQNNRGTRPHSRTQRPPRPKLLFSFLPTASEGDPNRILLQADQLSRSFGDRLLFRDASFYLRCGERLFLLGPNGCGKSTLLAILLGRLPADSGTVSLSSRSVFGLMSQEFSFPDESATILQTLLSAYDLDDGQARNLLARYGFRDVDVFKSVSVLSGGERARLYLCHLLLDRPDLLFLDEPTNHLDIRSREILETALLEYSGALLVVSHDRYLIERLATRVLGFIGAAVLPFEPLQRLFHRPRQGRSRLPRRPREPGRRFNRWFDRWFGRWFGRWFHQAGKPGDRFRERTGRRLGGRSSSHCHKFRDSCG